MISCVGFFSRIAISSEILNRIQKNSPRLCVLLNTSGQEISAFTSLEYFIALFFCVRSAFSQSFECRSGRTTNFLCFSNSHNDTKYSCRKCEPIFVPLVLLFIAVDVYLCQLIFTHPTICGTNRSTLTHTY